jgi:hypothetical protein
MCRSVGTYTCIWDKREQLRDPEREEESGEVLLTIGGLGGGGVRHGVGGEVGKVRWRCEEWLGVGVMDGGDGASCRWLHSLDW